MTHAIADLVRDVFQAFHSFLMDSLGMTSKSAGIVILLLGIGVGVVLLYAVAKSGARKNSQD